MPSREPEPIALPAAAADACARTGPDALPLLAAGLCQAAARGATRAHVPGVDAIDDDAWRRQTDEDDFAYTLRLLARYRFEFRDLGLSPDDAQYARLRMHRKLREITGVIAAKQPSHASAALVATLGHLGANLIGYELDLARHCDHREQLM